MDTKSTYDAMAGSYLQGKTTTLFRTLQNPIICGYMEIARRDKEYQQLNILIVGPGPQGNVEEWINNVVMKDSRGNFIWPFDEIEPDKITYLDNSRVTLDTCRRFVETETKKRTGKSGGQFILSSGENLVDYVDSNQFDIVLGALCDHMEPRKFFRSSYCVLKPGGALITTYPADGLNRLVREQVYQIPPTYTRFIVDGEVHLVPSTLMSTVNLWSQYDQNGYVDKEAVAAAAGKIKVTDTIKQAAQMGNLDPQQAPLVVVGFGRKSFWA